MRRWIAVCVAAVAVLGFLVAFGPTRLRPWECKSIRSAGSPKAATKDYYAACWNRPSIDANALDEGSAPAGAVGDGHAWHHLVEFSVRYGGGEIRFLLVGQRHAGDEWRPVEGEGTGP